MDLSSAESEAAPTETESYADDFQAMKVIDLKKELKARGLPVAGNKTELIERLQESQLSTKDTSGGSELEGFDHFETSQINDLDSEVLLHPATEDNSLFDDSQLSSPDKSITDEAKVLSIPTDTNLSSDPSAMSKPLKKRAIAKSVDGNIIEKKLQLNRTHSAVTPLIPVTKPVPPSPTRKMVIVAEEKNGDEKKPVSVKSMTESERLAMRAKRFNVTNSGNATTPDSNLGLQNSKVGEFKPVTLSGVSHTSDINVLKKRAERFGQNVSTVMRQIEEKEKILKRKLKFGASAVSTTAGFGDQELKKRRSERFGAL